MRIRTQLLFMSAAILLPMMLAVGVALAKIQDSEREAALRGLRETVRATALIVDREVQGSLSALKVLADSPHLHTGDFRGFYAQAHALDQPPDVWTLLLDSSGQQLVNTVVPHGTQLPLASPAARGRVTRTIATQKPVVSDLVLGPLTGKLVTTIYVPTPAGGGTSMVVGQAFSVDFWKKTAMQAKLPSDWVVGVVDRNGKFISRSHNAEELLGKSARPELVSAAAAAHDGLIRHLTLDGVDSYDAFTHSDLTGWTIAVAAPVETIEASARRAINVALGGMLLAVVAAIVAVVAFGRNFILAIDRARRSARVLGYGDKPAMLATSIEEVNELNWAIVNAGSLLHAERVSRRQAEAERERLLGNEKEARESAEAQNKAKDQFLAMLGHELRSPLAAIAGASALLNRPGTDADRLKRCVDIIGRQNYHLGRIVDDLLDINRLVAGKIELKTVQLNLEDVVAKYVAALQMTNRDSGHRIMVDASPAWIVGDPVRIEQILSNLVNNALKFSPTGGEITISVGELKGNAFLSVHDTGVGMSEELLEKVFEPFVQGPPPLDPEHGGLGIGLALVRQLVELHHGGVTAASAGPGHGSLFTVRIPGIPAPLSPEVKKPFEAQRKCKIVYVEDNPDARATMSDLLESFGYEVVQAIDGYGALAAVKSARPDIVLLDIGLPDISGYEVARRLRKDPAVSSIPLVALTGYGLQSDKDAAIKAGFRAHVVKPADPSEILSTISEVLEAEVDDGFIGV